MQIADIRHEYRLQRLSKADVAPSPIAQFQRWFDEAMRAEIPEGSAMTLATVSGDGRPSARIVLMKALDEQGITFFTNYQSRKGNDIAENAHAALLFFWPALERQVRIEGAIEKISIEESDMYFSTRPLGSRISAIASAQSEEIGNRKLLEAQFEDAAAIHGTNPPRPVHWGGYLVRPTEFEFWQGRESRLHDRVCYRLGAGGWRIFRRAP